MQTSKNAIDFSLFFCKISEQEAEEVSVGGLLQ
jgi:hypothetical protein